MRINWVLMNKIAIGDAPTNVFDLNLIKKKGIKSILSVCKQEEIKFPKELAPSELIFKSFPLPDHKDKKLITLDQINSCLLIIEGLLKKGPCFIHCYAGVERSPLICIAWLVKNENVSLDNALSYMMREHKGTNPLQSQLNVIKNI